nr:PREDICTED: uncharacterized protein LOC109031724 [Bemisia tabaci]
MVLNYCSNKVTFVIFNSWNLYSQLVNRYLVKEFKCVNFNNTFSGYGVRMSSKKVFGHRKFYALPEEYASKHVNFKPGSLSKKEDPSKLVKYIDENVIGNNITFLGPFGRRRVVYCDYTASGRSLQFIEDYILKEVLPAYGNTHTTTTLTSLQTTLFRHESRDIFRNAVHATEDDVVIFAGNGTTGAVHKLIHALDLIEPPVVFVGPCEHHSNLLPWREIGAKIIRISETKEGFLDLVDLENQLQLHSTMESPDTKLIGCFTAASNITGIVADDIATTLLLHQYGALAFWDFATAAPYVQMDMNPLFPSLNEGAVHKDAIYFSGHKFVGGVQTPGILIAKKSLFQNPIPEGCGGGTVFFVMRNGHRYLQDTELREEGGTGAIVESIRAGLAMQLKLAVGVSNIMTYEEKIVKTFLSHVRTIPEILLLGNTSHGVKRLPIFSFLVRHPRGTFLHHNFICSVLNDVFGIQARGGCACAGPYAQDLMGIDEDLAMQYEQVLLEDSRLDRHHLRRHEEHSSYEMLRPGFTRISIPFFMSDSELNFVLEALKMVATEGWKLLPQYLLNPETGEWRHHTNVVFKDRKWLGSIRYTDGKMTVNERKMSGQIPCPKDYNECLQTARNLFNKARKMAQRFPLADQTVMFNEMAESLRWFMLPSEAQDLLLGNCLSVKTNVPFDPCNYQGSRGSIADLPQFVHDRDVFSRHHSLSALDTSSQRDSHSPHQDPSNLHSYSMYSTLSPRGLYQRGRERCYSLGSTPPPLPLHPRLSLGISRNRQCSIGSQTELNSLSDSENRDDQDARCSDTASPPVIINNQAHLQAYVKEVTEELATEIKSELREVIATVDSALSESSESLSEYNYLDRRQSQLPQMKQNMNGTGAFFPRNNSVPVIVTSSFDTATAPHSAPLIKHGSIPSSYTSHNNVYLPEYSYSQPNSFAPLCTSETNDGASPTTDVTEHVAEYLAELTTEMVSEMKSEFREMVSAVDEIISPNVERSSLTSLSTDDMSDSETTKKSEGCRRILNSSCEFRKKPLLKSGEVTNNTSSQDSGINGSCSDKEANSLDKQESDTDKMSSESTLECFYQSDNDPCRKKSVIEVEKPRWHCPPRNIWKPTTDAILDFDMIKDGDRVMVCLSGGKDSLSLLHTLHQFQYYAKSKGISFKLGAATVDPGSSAYNPQPLIPYLKLLGVHYLYEKQPILEQAASVNCSSICSFCSRMKRGRLYAAARNNNYNVLALGQHLDDLAESFLMSTFHNGRLRTMKAHYYIKEKDLRVIRPFIYVRERNLRQFAESRKLPVIPENCPACFEAPKERHRTKQLLAQQEILFPKLFTSIRSALLPLISFHHTGEESKTYNEFKSTSKKRKEAFIRKVPVESESDTDEDSPVACQIQGSEMKS